jgi:iron complex transport system ATP-binding protein
VEGVAVASLAAREVARKMAYVPQNACARSVTVFDAVLLGRRPYIEWGASQTDLRIVADTLRLLELEGCALKTTDELSGGELQKVVLARALVQEPRVILLDEPTNNLDMRNQLEVMRLIATITHTRRICSVVVMHDVNLALRYADTFVAIKQGQVCAQGEVTGIDSRLIEDVYDIRAVVENVRGVPAVIPMESNQAARSSLYASESPEKPQSLVGKQVNRIIP